jgi:hypothetical protein
MTAEIGSFSRFSSSSQIQSVIQHCIRPVYIDLPTYTVQRNKKINEHMAYANIYSTMQKVCRFEEINKSGKCNLVF